MAKLSIMGLYNYNPEIFDDLTVPTGIDKETVIDNILLECYDLELLFPSYNLMKIAIRTWSNTEQPIWQKLYNTENLVYNPIWNVDGDVTETREVTREKTGEDGRTITNSGTKSETIQGTKDTETNDSGTVSTSDSNTVTSSDSTSGTSENVHSQAGYNESNLVITEKDNGTTSTTGQGTRTESGTGTRTESGTGNVSEEYGETKSGTDSSSQTDAGTNSETETVGETLHTRRTGNIGVTTTQQMIREERDIDAFSTIEYITNSFKKRFCLLVY